MKTVFSKGQTLVETVAALAVAVIVVAALVGMAIGSLRSSNLSRSKALASQLVSEEIEKVRIYRDTNTFAALSSDLTALRIVPTCSIGVAGPFSVGSGGAVSGNSETISQSGLSFTRSFTACYTDATDTVIEVTATVSWTDSTGTHPLRSTTWFSDWR